MYLHDNCLLSQAQDCPEGLHSGFMLLFPGVSAISQLTVITLSEHTINDMTGWSSAIEEEREQLLEHVSHYDITMMSHYGTSDLIVLFLVG